MILSTYFNQANNVLICSTSRKHEHTLTEGNITKLISENQIVGLNYFDPKIELKSGLVDVALLPEEISNIFSESLENPFVVGLICEVEKHPKSEKLNICQVDIGTSVTQIICGAGNVSAGIKVVVAKVGAVMPNGINIGKSKLIDVESNGMICSFRELGLPQTEPGIIILDSEYQVGQDYL